MEGASACLSTPRGKTEHSFKRGEDAWISPIISLNDLQAYLLLEIWCHGAIPKQVRGMVLLAPT